VETGKLCTWDDRNLNIVWQCLLVFHLLELNLIFFGLNSVNLRRKSLLEETSFLNLSITSMNILKGKME
jgi:hypothetical protein